MLKSVIVSEKCRRDGRKGGKVEEGVKEKGKRCEGGRKGEER